MQPRTRRLLGISAVGLFTLLTAIPVGAQSYSHSRVIRLSFVEGNVTIQRPDVQGWAEAPVNTPLEQGFKLSTGENSFAEIQFESGGAIRLGERSSIDFTALEVTQSGGTVDRVELRQGYATFHPLASRFGESLQVQTPLGKLVSQGGAEFRVDLDQGIERVEVTNGSVEEESDLGPMTIEKDSVLVMQPNAAEPLVVSQGITPDDWDQWVADREAQVEAPASGPSPDTYTGDANEQPYGWAELAENGNWTDVQGEGYGWSPYVAAGWAPYSSGQWCWYPGRGYTWIGSEPWGWLPYHYGSWEFVPGKGWVWFPGSLRTWSPALVTWYQGPNWIGWTPRPHRPSSANCGNYCGGGTVSTGAFRRGGLLTPSRMLSINPISGTLVNAPRITPSATAMLPGVAVANPAAQQSKGFEGNTAPSPGITGMANTSVGSHGAATTNPNSGIVYDPQEGSYVNGRHNTRPQMEPAFPASPAGTTVTQPAATRGWTQSVPAHGRAPGASPVEGQGFSQPSSGAYASPRTAPAASGYNSGGARPSGGSTPAGASHGGGWAPAESHSSPPPSGGGHSAPSGGGAVGGHH